MSIETVQLLEKVCAGLQFPAARWQLVAAAELYGVDADTHDQLAHLACAHYANPTQVFNAMARGPVHRRPDNNVALSTTAALAALHGTGSDRAPTSQRQ